MKWYSYLFCIVLIFIGVFFGIKFYTEIKAESYINGSIDISNEFYQETFNYSSSSLNFYHDDYDVNDLYIYEIDLLKVENFNGLEKQYNVYLNDFILIDSVISAGTVDSRVVFEFIDTDGKLISSCDLNISINFLSNKTTLNISTIGKVNASFYEQYFNDNGIRLKVIEVL